VTEIEPQIQPSRHIQGMRIHITGIVQGVGFRPFIYNLATRMMLFGWVRNTSAGVDIEVDGNPDQLSAFLQAIRAGAPPLARMDTFETSTAPAFGFTTFEIVHSASNPGDFIPIAPDVSICPDCLRELFDPSDRRYRYPFINCTNCGPRFTIIENIPYDRPNTTMRDFPLCAPCSNEYHDPTNRRFHAQPVACPVCGPHVWVENNLPETLRGTGDPVRYAQSLLASGQILAIKGLGGFHLACDATNPAAVQELRRRKLRVGKAFAVMALDLETAHQHAYLSDTESVLLESRQRPIVIVRRRPESNIAAEVAPGQDTIGLMLPYTPLHYLLLDQSTPGEARPYPLILVMTSGNLSEEPIVTDNDEAHRRLASLCDAFLLHNRPIRTRCDDSVLRVIPLNNRPAADAVETAPAAQSAAPLVQVLRRSRGFAPDPLRLPVEAVPLLATGPELKNTFCMTRGSYAFVSHHIGDLENLETYQAFEDGINHFERLFRVQPQALAYDLHPNYLATRYALERAEREGLASLGIQHHHAHIAACMADNGLDGAAPVIGVAFDGTGFGSDGNIWGGEFLLSDYTAFQRLAHLEYFPLPGGDAATRQPWRSALAGLWQAGLAWDADLPPVRWVHTVSSSAAEPGLSGSSGVQRLEILARQLEKRIHTPLTSSMGRLFDGAAALAGVRQTVNYEAQAAIEFEALADTHETGHYPFEIQDQPVAEPVPPSLAAYHFNRRLTLLPGPLWQAIRNDLRLGVPVAYISARFHNGIAELVRRVVTIIRQESGISQVALSGGVWQNITLLTKTITILQADGFTVLTHRQAPPNDGGVAFGQAAIAAYHFNNQKIHP